MCDICNALGQEVLDDGTVIQVGPAQSDEAIMAAFLSSPGLVVDDGWPFDDESRPRPAPTPRTNGPGRSRGRHRR